MSDPFKLIEALDYKGLEAYLKVENINVLNEHKQSLLDAAIASEFDDAFDLLIKNYINLNTLDDSGNTPLMYSILYNKIGYFKRLVREGANLNLTNNKGESAIMIALNQRKMDMAHILLDSGVDLKVVDKNDENICFSIVRSHNLPLLKEIIAKNKNLLFSINYTRRNLLHEACMVKDHNIALYLLNNGLLANSADNFGETPIFFAAREKDYDMIKLLISYGAIIEKRNGFYETVLDIAKGEIHDYIEYQMQSVRYNRYLKKYPLHVAVINNDFLRVKQQANRYNMNKKDDFNYRPIDYARLLNYTDSYNLLKQYEKLKN
jgi:ankyrin repeat protein